MVDRVGMLSITARATVVVAILAALAGCGSSSKGNATARARLAADASTPSTPVSCAATVLEVLGHVAKHVYHEGVKSERTGSALYSIKASIPLREAVERGDARATRAAAAALVAGGHVTNLQVIRGSVLADVGSPGAVTPLRGTLIGAAGTPIGSFVTSVWADGGLVAETHGITESSTVLRAKGRTVAGSFALPPGELPARGTLSVKGVEYQYTSFGGKAYPSGSPLRVYLFRPTRSTAHLCGSTEQDTVVNTLTRVATLIYDGESGGRTLPQIRRVQGDQELLQAVARRDPLGTRQAIVSLLTQHIVRLRVSAGGSLLSDVGGPFVLGPVRAELRLGGRTIGSFELSIQDDEGYLRLTHRLAGLDVLMYMGSRLVKNSLGPEPGAIPAGGPFRYRGRSFRAFTLIAKAFPSGPLRIKVLIPIPYS